MTGKTRYVESHALIGSVQCIDGTTVIFIDPPEEEGGADVPAVIVPKPSAPSTSVALPIPT